MINFRVRKLTTLLAMSLALLSASSIPVWAIQVKVADAPDTNLALTLEAIRSAKQLLQINIYELTSVDIVNAIAAQIQAGVEVELLIEGQPVGTLSAAAQSAENHLLKSMQAAGKGHLYLMAGKTGGPARRFHFDHAKYTIVDSSQLLIGSENYSPTGNPRPGSVGNRGWEVLLNDADLARKFQALFKNDTATSFGDVIDLTAGAPLAPSRPHPRPRPAPPTRSQFQILNADQAFMTTSPDHSVNDILAQLNGAKIGIDIELMTFDSQWGNTGGNSPLFDAVMAAARRGLHVRVLLNDESAFDKPGHPAKRTNHQTVDLFNQAALKEGLKLSAMISNNPAMGVDYIHNKGALIDGTTTLISSINWDFNSFTANRETAVLIVGPQVFSFYESLYQKDWLASGGRNAQFRSPNP